jgi:ribosomal protein S18 acetylase RimI-like enzyme
MQFDLSEALVDAILFSMEDQSGKFLLDTEQAALVPVSEIDPGAASAAKADDFGRGGERYIELPDWGPPEGFRLMECFAAGLRNPVVREELSAALNQGRGVFRAFKNVLAEHPETGKIWFRFKEREMKKKILRWYNALREIWGLELIGDEPEETVDMVLEDFTLRGGSGGDREAAAGLHRCCEEYLNNENGSGNGARIFAGMNPWVFPGDICLVAESAGKDFAGYVSAVYGDSSLHICALEVKPEYRGLGLGETLLAALLEKTDAKKIKSVSVDLPAGMEGFSRVLIRESFRPCVRRYLLETGAKNEMS